MVVPTIDPHHYGCSHHQFFGGLFFGVIPIRYHGNFINNNKGGWILCSEKSFLGGEEGFTMHKILLYELHWIFFWGLLTDKENSPGNPPKKKTMKLVWRVLFYSLIIQWDGCAIPLK
jgi:hypothetical protein